MNLFCFSLEGSMDSLYEAVQTSGDNPPQSIPSRSSSRSCSRSCSPALLLDNNTRQRGSGRSISMEMTTKPQINTHKKKRTQVSKSASDNEALADNSCNAVVWKVAMSPEDLVHTSNNHNEETKRTKHKVDLKGGKSAHHSGPKKRDKNTPCQNSNTKRAAPDSKQVAKRNQKPGKKSNGKKGKEGVKKSPNITVHPPAGATSPQMGPLYLNVPYRSDRRPHLSKFSTLPIQETTTPGRCNDMISLPGGATPTHYHNQNQRWSNPADNSPVWGTVQHTCRRPLTEYHVSSDDFGLPHRNQMQQLEDKEGTLTMDFKLHIPPKVTRSFNDLDLLEPNRSTSFGRFEGLRHNPSPANTEENGTDTPSEECESLEPNKSAGIGKKMKAISLTMRRKMGKKHAKSFSEEMIEDMGTETAPSAEKNSTRASNSLESLYSGQSSSSGVTSESNCSGQRDSLRLEEDGSYQGQFCGRARVHTDFVPSPYDTDSLKLKAGDIISIISKPPMGIWTGMLNNRVGNFKFIYVDILVEKEEKGEGDDNDEAPKIRQQKLCQRPRPKTLLELLERLNLEEYASALLLNGYQTVEDLTHLQEKHLIELNVKDPEDRRKLLAASQCHYSEGDDVRNVDESKSSGGLQEEDSDCPRDSGCFIPSECSDSKEDAEPLKNSVAS
ncbi:SAM domain-containing protein SAMSN-1a isoform X3 [Corythoichthys intestinalis]|uniref:SAM domain-containing protein SAMSN-1a isoform X3 n=1 Tax=Corythoichthys intestinalis TaxID=161448 RepID=UPI0025A65BFC|nr:SAM domain-containing protein SAMSN-1a isoform X3 [Corythoichthys intestinalis]